MIDLHCHTNISDNSMTIDEVVALAARNGVTHLAITDHDTTMGLEYAANVGQQLGVKIVPGIEISAYDFKRGCRAHILGLYVQPGHRSLSELCDPILKRRHEACRDMAQAVIGAGYEITWEQVERYAAGGTGVYKQHIMHALLDNGYSGTIYGDLYRKLFSRGGNGVEPGVAYIPVQYLDAFDAIRAVREAGGVPVIAHPKQYGNFEAIPEWVEAGLAGIEVRHPSHDAEAEEAARALAERYGLIMTGGSDFHGFYGETDRFTLGGKSPGIEAIHALERFLG